MKDLSKVPTWRLEWDLNLRSSGWKSLNLPLSHRASLWLYCGFIIYFDFTMCKLYISYLQKVLMGIGLQGKSATDLVTETDLFKDGEGLKEGKESQIIDYFNQSIKVLLEVTVDRTFLSTFRLSELLRQF